MYSCRPPHMANQKQDGQLEHIYSSYVMIRDVTLKTCQRRWMIGRCGERGSGISMLAAQNDDDDYGNRILFLNFFFTHTHTHTHIEPKMENILRKNQNGFRRNRSTTSQILTIRRILEGVRAKNLQATLLFVDFTKAFDSIHRGKMEQILLAYGLPKETVAAIMILYRNTKVKVRSPDGDTEYFDIVAGVLQGDTLAPYLFIICLDYVLRTSIDKIRENGFELTKRRSKRYPAKTITDADYADDLALLANTPNQAETLLHSLERAAAGIGLHVNANKTEYVLQPNRQHCHTRRSLSETSRQIHLPRKQRLINREGHRHTTDEGMDSYR